MVDLNTAEFKKFEGKRKEWLEWLGGKDRHSICNQVQGVIWDAAVFRVINTQGRGSAWTFEFGVGTE